jgi:hypothetical protein
MKSYRGDEHVLAYYYTILTSRGDGVAGQDVCSSTFARCKVRANILPAHRERIGSA